MPLVVYRRRYLVIRHASIYGFCRSLEDDCGGEAGGGADNLLFVRRTVQAYQPECALQGADARQGAILTVLGALHSPPIDARICTTPPLPIRILLPYTGHSEHALVMARLSC